MTTSFRITDKVTDTEPEVRIWVFTMLSGRKYVTTDFTAANDLYNLMYVVTVEEF